jgi:hypothetical protein
MPEFGQKGLPAKECVVQAAPGFESLSIRMIKNEELDYEVGQMFASATEDFIREKFPELNSLDLAVENFTYFEEDVPKYFVFAQSSMDKHKYVEFIIDGVDVNGDVIRPYSMNISPHGFPATSSLKTVWKVNYERDFD